MEARHTVSHAKGIRWKTNVKQVAEDIQQASRVSRGRLREAVRKRDSRALARNGTVS